MTRLAARGTRILLAAALLGLGVLGALGYARDYDVHRGFAALEPLPRAGTGRLEQVHFYSSALRRSADYLVYLPPGYTRHRRYPTYYLLHGMPGQPKVFIDIANMDVRLDNQMSLGHARPMILVFPDGRIGGSVFSDSEWANTPSGHFESYVLEVVRNVDHRFSALPRRQDRVIGGFSAGGFGAINIALHALHEFANVQVWSGYYTETRTGVFAHASRAVLAANSPIDEVPRLATAIRREPLRVDMFVGRDDSSARQQLPMVRALRAAGARVSDAFYRGGHDWSVWYPRLNAMLDLASADVSHPLAPGTRISLPPPSQPTSVLPSAATHRGRIRSSLSTWRLILGLLIALVSAALINLGFVLQHRGRARALARGRTRLVEAFAERAWLAGQAIGWIGFAGSIVALAMDPLTLVQAFAVGSLAISVPLAAWMLGARIRTGQLVAIVVIALCLVSLPIGFVSGQHPHLLPGVLIVASVIALFAALPLRAARHATVAAVGSGVLYGLADAAIKADAVALRRVGVSGLLSGWTVLAGLATFGGFLAFQSALRHRDAVLPLTLMNAFTAITASLLGVVAFGEHLGRSPVATITHVVAILLVLACIRPLLAAQQRFSDTRPTTASDPEPDGPVTGARPPSPRRPAGSRIPEAARTVLSGTLLVALVLLSCCAGIGLLYGLRSASVLAVGPRVPDALPLLGLAGFAGQPLARVLLAWITAGLCLRALTPNVPVVPRVLVCGAFGAVALLAGSDASFALAHNLRLGQVLLHRAPGLGPWVELLLLAGASSAPLGLAPSFAPSELARPSPRAVRALRASRRLQIALCGTLALAAMGSGIAIASNSAPSLRRWHAHGQLAPRLEARVDRETGGRLRTVDFYARALGKTADYLVYLPREYHRTRPLPVLVLLHGTPGKPLAFTVNAAIEVRLERLIARRAAVPMILVFPDGRIDGVVKSDTEWANTPAGRYESYVNDVVRDVDRRYATLACRQERGIGGLSEGGYGAMNIGLHEIGAFSLIQSWSGYFRETHNGVFAHADRATMRFDSPIDYVRTMSRPLRHDPLRVVLFAGEHDPYHREVAPMAAALRSEHVQVFAAIYPGGHDWHTWDAHVDAMLRDASRDFEHPLQGASPGCPRKSLRTRPALTR